MKQPSGAIVGPIGKLLSIALPSVEGALGRYALWNRTELQHTASAAALAGVLDLTDKLDPAGVPDTDDYRKKAVEYAYKNMSGARHGRVLNANCGTYNTVTGAVNGDTDQCDDVKAGKVGALGRRRSIWPNHRPEEA